MEILEREKEILRLCHTYAYVDGSYIKHHVFYSQQEEVTEYQERYFYRRMKMLVDEGYLYRYQRVSHDYSDKKDAIYCLSTKGVNYAKAEFTAELRYRFNPTKQLVESFNHYLAILRVVEAIRKSLRVAEQEFIEFYTEAESFYQYSEDKKDRIRPDGIFLIRYHEGNKKGLTLAFFLEVERVFHNNKAQEKKLLNYNGFLSSVTAQQSYARRLNEEVNSFAMFFVATENMSYNRLENQLLGLKSQMLTKEVFKKPFFLSHDVDILNNAQGEIYQNLSKEDTAMKTSIF